MITVRNKNHWLVEQSSLQSDNRAIITEDRSLNYSEFLNEVCCLRDYLINHGIKGKDHVGILYGHNYKFFAIINALWFIGAIPVPLNTRNTNKEIESQLQQADIKYLIIDGNFSEQYSHIHFRNKIQIFQSVMVDLPPETNELLNSKFAILNSSLIMFTSGSSGSAKAVVHNFHSLSESVANMDSFANLGNNDVWLASLPLYHIGGFMILVRALLSGGRIAFPNSLKQGDIAESLSMYNPTYVSIVSTMLNRFIEDNLKPPTNLKFVFLGGGPVSSNLSLQAIDSGWPIIKVYGSTETCTMITTLLPGEAKQKPNSAGKLLGSNKIKIMSKNNSSDLSFKEEAGEIVVSSQSLFTGYYNDEQTTDNVLKKGWYYTGDYGWIDKEGYLYISSRREDLIITGGENVSIQEIEIVIKALHQIEDVCAFALEDNNWGQIIYAAIVSTEITEPEIISFLKSIIASYKIPKKFFFVDSIPKNEMGKVKRKELLEKLNLS